jgi:hypothetical protein
VLSALLTSGFVQECLHGNTSRAKFRSKESVS